MEQIRETLERAARFSSAPENPAELYVTVDDAMEIFIRYIHTLEQPVLRQLIEEARRFHYTGKEFENRLEELIEGSDE